MEEKGEKTDRFPPFFLCDNRAKGRIRGEAGQNARAKLQGGFPVLLLFVWRLLIMKPKPHTQQEPKEKLPCGRKTCCPHCGMCKKPT